MTDHTIIRPIAWLTLIASLLLGLYWLLGDDVENALLCISSSIIFVGSMIALTLIKQDIFPIDLSPQEVDPKDYE